MYPYPHLSCWDFDPFIRGLGLLNHHPYSNLGYHNALSSLNDYHRLSCVQSLPYFIQGFKLVHLWISTPDSHNIDTLSTSSHEIFIQNVKLFHDLGHVLVPLLIFLYILDLHGYTTSNLNMAFHPIVVLLLHKVVVLLESWLATPLFTDSRLR